MSEADANDDDDDDYIGDSKTDRKLARRMAHTVAEQKRRDQIKVCNNNRVPLSDLSQRASDHCVVTFC